MLWGHERNWGDGERGRPAGCVRRLTEHAARCIGLVPVGETPTGAAETAALPIQSATVGGQDPWLSLK